MYGRQICERRCPIELSAMPEDHGRLILLFRGFVDDDVMPSRNTSSVKITIFIILFNKLFLVAILAGISLIERVKDVMIVVDA